VFLFSIEGLFKKYLEGWGEGRGGERIQTRKIHNLEQILRGIKIKAYSLISFDVFRMKK